MKRKIIWILSLTFILIFSIVFYFLFLNRSNTCNDGTPYNECSEIKPYFCFEGVLIEKASVCGCDVSRTEGDKCLSSYQIEPKNITLNYILRGKRGQIKFVVYKKMDDYISSIPRYIDSSKNPTLLDFKLKLVNEPYQRELLLPLVVQIENMAKSKEDQARIAISIVQEIPFGSSDKTTKIGNSAIEYQRYPYEVLYDMEGICSEKTELLVFLLREIGYGTAFLYYSAENHEAVGIKCPSEKANIDGYCFIETTDASIITDDRTEYFGVTRKLNSTPEIIEISDGLVFDSNFYEYKDVKNLISIRENLEKYGVLNFIEHIKLKRLKNKYGLATFYNSYIF
jgi:hypothetical protein